MKRPTKTEGWVEDADCRRDVIHEHELFESRHKARSGNQIRVRDPPGVTIREETRCEEAGVDCQKRVCQGPAPNEDIAPDKPRSETSACDERREQEDWATWPAANAQGQQVTPDDVTEKADAGSLCLPQGSKCDGRLRTRLRAQRKAPSSQFERIQRCLIRDKADGDSLRGQLLATRPAPSGSTESGSIEAFPPHVEPDKNAERRNAGSSCHTPISHQSKQRGYSLDEVEDSEPTEPSLPAPRKSTIIPPDPGCVDPNPATRDVHFTSTNSAQGLLDESATSSSSSESSVLSKFSSKDRRSIRRLWLRDF